MSPSLKRTDADLQAWRLHDLSKADKFVVEAMGFRFQSSTPNAVSYSRLNSSRDICEDRDSFFMTVLRWARGRQWWPDFIAKSGWHHDVSCAAIPVDCIDGHILSRRLYEYLVREIFQPPLDEG
jgi:hypothetical protein